MQLAISLLIFVVIPTMLAWREWIKADRSAINDRRKTAFAAGLVVTTSALLLFAAFVAYTTSIGGFKTDYRSLLKWSKGPPNPWMLAGRSLRVTDTGCEFVRDCGEEGGPTGSSIRVLDLWQRLLRGLPYPLIRILERFGKRGHRFDSSRPNCTQGLACLAPDVGVIVAQLLD